MPLRILNPDTLAAPLGKYSHVARVPAGELVFIAGQVALDANGELVGEDDVVAQTHRVFENLDNALQSQGCSFADVARFTTYLVRSHDLQTFRDVRAELFEALYPSGNYPPNTLLVVDRLVTADFLIEVEAIASVPG
jgi:enamine deaminase RidA (YjgF/YER057c/UK114 family)